MSAEHRDRSFAYKYPTIRSLSKFTFDLASGTLCATPLGVRNAAGIDNMYTMLDRLSQRLPKPRARTDIPEPIPRPCGGDVVVVTGTTGALGSAVLAELVACDQVSRVYTLDRRSPSGVALRLRQEESLMRRNLEPDVLNSPKVVSLQADLAVAGFGVDEDVYREVRSLH